MGSSKIQERNLDPNMGLAHESTSQEILEKLNHTGGGLSTIAGVNLTKVKMAMAGDYTVTEKETKTFTFEGAKKIHACYIYFQNSGSRNVADMYDDLIVTIDGTTYDFSGVDPTKAHDIDDDETVLCVDMATSAKIGRLYIYAEDNNAYLSDPSLYPIAQFECEESISFSFSMEWQTDENTIKNLRLYILYEDL